MGRKAPRGPPKKEPQTLPEGCKELESLLEEARLANEVATATVDSINQVHSKLKSKASLNHQNRTKLKDLYGQSLNETETEINALKAALEKIERLKSIRGNKRSHVANAINPDHLGLSTPNSPKKTTLRRGLLMKLLEETASALPLWLSEGPAPPLCGSVPAASNYIVPPGGLVAAKVKHSAGEGEEDESENWILAECVSYNSSSGKYEVDDIDEENKERHSNLSKRRVVPLPLYKADPLRHPDAIFPREACVMALYPQTTCFYRAVVHEQPTKVHEEYRVRFEDSSYSSSGGFSPPLNVPPCYIVQVREEPSSSASVSSGSSRRR